MINKDIDLENLLELNGIRYVVNDILGLWVKFETRRVSLTANRPNGIKYSLTLHDRTGKRILGFDNSHAVGYEGKKGAFTNQPYDHWHRDGDDKGRPYNYENAEKLICDFWTEVDTVIHKLEKAKYEH